ncbi:polysaccharide biosynthesis/export family protein [Chryseobacterium sp. MP_3.2]|uniref:polysaccharide biosynthesis/export family protein n=1 Tax=Chryseobacterium sp. MP_3.2 TaxID=3071712 RepID=UPI002E020054|nr:polysaccharide export outer membrane protein [Chryseobacterium sp. MP_3.2]
MNYKIFPLYIAILFAFSSCKTKEKTTGLSYLQNVEQIATDVSISNSKSTIQVGDQLVIFVTSKNMDVVKPFNQGYYSSQNSATPGNASNSSNSEKLYEVDENGDIDFPLLGKINTTQISLEDLKSDLTFQISSYVKNPTVSVRLANFKVTLLGEVAKPGQYILSEKNPSILNALGIAGDLTMYGKRNDVLIVRNINGQITKSRINLIDENFVNSPYFNLKQGDVIYVSPTETKERAARQDPNTAVYIAVAGTIVGLAGIFITIFKN